MDDSIIAGSSTSATERAGVCDAALTSHVFTDRWREAGRPVVFHVKQGPGHSPGDDTREPTAVAPSAPGVPGATCRVQVGASGLPVTASCCRSLVSRETRDAKCKCRRAGRSATPHGPAVRGQAGRPMARGPSGPLPGIAVRGILRTEVAAARPPSGIREGGHDLRPTRLGSTRR